MLAINANVVGKYEEEVKTYDETENTSNILTADSDMHRDMMSENYTGIEIVEHEEEIEAKKCMIPTVVEMAEVEDVEEVATCYDETENTSNILTADSDMHRDMMSENYTGIEIEEYVEEVEIYSETVTKNVSDMLSFDPDSENDTNITIEEHEDIEVGATARENSVVNVSVPDSDINPDTYYFTMYNFFKDQVQTLLHSNQSPQIPRIQILHESCKLHNNIMKIFHDHIIQRNCCNAEMYHSLQQKFHNLATCCWYLIESIRCGTTEHTSDHFSTHIQENSACIPMSFTSEANIETEEIDVKGIEMCNFSHQPSSNPNIDPNIVIQNYASMYNSFTHRLQATLDLDCDKSSQVLMEIYQNSCKECSVIQNNIHILSHNTSICHDHTQEKINDVIQKYQSLAKCYDHLIYAIRNKNFETISHLKNFIVNK